MPSGFGARIEPLDLARHDRAGFSCGVEAVDNFFHRTAGKLVRAGHLRVFVMARGAEVMGFHALNAHAVDYADLPARFARDRPRHGSIPAAFIAMIGRDRRHAGAAIGADLLVDALRRAARAADQVGIAVVVLDVLDCGDPFRTERRRELYAGYGFHPLSSRPSRMFLPMAAVRALVGSSP